MSRILHKTIYTLNTTGMLATLKGGVKFTQKGPTPPATVTFRTRCASDPNIRICMPRLFA